jgi:2-keto-3-deoxy-L-rhamnonate aldolase RhmA
MVPQLVQDALRALGRGHEVTDLGLSARTAADAAAAVQAAKYAPVGRRSSASSSRAANYGLTQSPAEYFRQANEQTMVVPLVEEVEGFANLVAIGQTPGIDLLFLGDGDLAMDMGFPGQRDHPEVRRAVETAIARGRAAGLAIGAAAASGQAGRSGAGTRPSSSRHVHA